MKKLVLVLAMAGLLVGCGGDGKEEVQEENRAFGRFQSDLSWYKRAIAAEEAGTPWAGVDITPKWRQLNDPLYVNPNPPVVIIPGVN